MIFEGLCQFLSSFGKFVGARLHLLEQSRVLDGDDGLIGEGLKQRDLLVTERPDLDASDRNDADGLTSTDQRDDQYCAEPTASGTVAAYRILTSFGLYIGDLNRSPIEHNTSLNISTQAHRAGHGNRPMVGDEPEYVAVRPRITTS